VVGGAVASLAAGFGVAACGGGGTPGASDVIVGVDALVGGEVVFADTSKPDVVVPVPEDFGQACAENSDCESGWCVDGPAGDVCTVMCLDDCPDDNYSCKAVITPTNATVFLCIPRHQNLCGPCEEDYQCDAGACLLLDGEGRCTYACEGDGDCPAGYVCEEDAEGAHPGAFCQPETKSCSCNAYTPGGFRTCERTNEHGTCIGVQACKTSAGWLACTAAEPAEEVCDGVDNDCDGLIDDQLVEGEPCMNDVEGVGSCAGTSLCVAGAWICQGPTPSVEACDTQDNDCDGEIDEDFRDADGHWTLQEHCGYCGNDCTDKIPGGVGRCGGTPESPVCVVDHCDEGFVQFNEFQCLPPVDVSCAPCEEDADCLGGSCVPFGGDAVCLMPCGLVPDACPSGFVCASGGAEDGHCVPDSGTCTCTAENEGALRPCASVNGLGACQGFEQCDPAVGWTGCTAPTPVAEVCDGLDNDCDGAVDEDLPQAGAACDLTVEGVGTCVGAQACFGEVGWVCQGELPKSEVCDFQDNDCDGETDEDFRAADGSWTLDAHCGTCGNDCVGKFPHGVGRCGGTPGSPLCVVDHCDPDYFKLNDFQCVLPPDVSCQPCASDADCYEGTCVALDGQQVCLMPCGTAAGACLDGYGCQSVIPLAGGPAVDRCAPVTGSCVCGASTAGQTRTCQVSNEHGTCFGQETCDATAGWQGCTAQEPAAEICDGLDNDCNGAADDGVMPPAAPCEESNAFGTCAGTWVCGDDGAGGTGWTCTAPTPAEEVCDFQDNDCDGVADQPFRDPVSGVYVDDLNCGSCGVSCAGAIPNATAHCAVAGDTARCEVASCAEGYFQVGPLTCLPVTDDLCAACVDDAGCPTPGDRCLALAEGSFCGRDCGEGNAHGTPAGECPAGYTCAEVGLGGGATTRQCRPTSGACSCLPPDEGATRPCVRTNAVGTCYGQEVCDPAAGWVGCSAHEPSSEVCDGVDNDCNGAVDDVPGRGAPCVTDSPFGQCAGVADCVAGEASLQCVGPLAQAEVCNYVDDDCDGATDEGFDDLYEVCSAGEGACRRLGVYECTADGSGTECNAVAAPAGVETCDGTDDDCDGFTDEGFAGLGDVCTVGTGACAAAGTWVCAADGQGTECSAVAGTPAASELCNGVDDDCDGATDEAFGDLGDGCTVGVGACERPGTRVCKADGSGTQCSAAPGTPAASETCDGLDNDCDGVVDEDIPGTPLCPLQQGVCVGAKERCAGASGGFLACDAGSYGASYELDEVSCDGLDNDCDGVTDEVDLDGDGHVDSACAAGYSGPLPADDCDDRNPLVNPALAELCGDAVDNDCDGAADNRDEDGDGHVALACAGGYGGSLPADDCDDEHAAARPGLDEVCGDGLDNDCDGSVDNVDLDGDKVLAATCGGTDCDDSEPSVHPGALELCDGLDNDCDSIVDNKDADADGHIDMLCGSYTGPLPVDDCDDGNLGVNPDRDEVCGNGVDEDCSGADSDKDLDGDGWVDADLLCGGTDCDDGDPLVYPTAPERRDGKDNDCDVDGRADEGLIAAGDIVVTEIFYDVSSAYSPDENYEWFEVFNPTDRPVDLNTWVLHDQPGTSQETAVVVQPVVVPPRGFATLCRTGAPNLNGGVTCDYEYGFMQLGNKADELILDFGSTTVDEVWYDEGGGWPVASGASLTLDPKSYAADNDTPGPWCEQGATPTFGTAGQGGTPGGSNVSCTLAATAAQLAAVHPDNGVAAGGTVLRLMGAGFADASDVQVGGTTCATWAVISDHEIRCTTPPGVAGPASVAVTDADGTDTLSGAFTYTATATGGGAPSATLTAPLSVRVTRGRWTPALAVDVVAAGVTGGGCPASGEYAAGALRVEVGLGAQGSDPRADGGWIWTPAFCDSSAGSTDAFVGAALTTSPGVFAATFRVSADGGATWVYADDDGSANGLDTGGLVTVTVL